MKLKEQHDAALNAARVIVNRAKAEGRTALSDAERTEVNGHLAKADDLAVQMKNAEESADIFARLDSLGSPDGPAKGRTSGRRFDAKSGLMQAMQVKALAAGTDVVAPAGLVVAAPIPLGRLAQDLLAVLPTEQVPVPPTFAYLRQTTRTNNAAAVAVGGTKPTSVYGVQRIEDRLRVVAHLSEPLDKYWLSDNASLSTFVVDELGFGLNVAVEDQVLNGDGTGENMTGILQTSGIQTQAFSTDQFETLRKALTKVQLLGGREPIIVLHPTDWEAMDLTRVTSSNQFLLGSADRQNVAGGEVSPPTGATALLSWGFPVALSTAVPVGSGVVFDPSAVTLYTDRTIEVAWDASAGFNKNQVQARVEGRFNVAVKKPALIVEADLAA